MTKKILFLFVLSSVFLYGCSSEVNVTNNDVLETNQENMNCADSVKNYLDNADFKGDGDTVENGDQIVVDYIGRLEDGTVFDTSVEKVAQDCGVYNSSRNYQEGLSFNVGAGQMIAGFDKAVVGMKLNQTKTINIPANEAYGERDEGALVSVDKSSFSGMDDLKRGDKVMTSVGQQFTVYEIKGDQIVIDTNPPLAGKDLIFDITVKEIK